MKNYLLLILAILIFGSCQNRNVDSTKAETKNKVVIGQIDSLKSDILKETRKIWVYVPQSLPASDSSKTRYPVLYLLDGDAHFHSVTGMIQQLSTINGNTVLPETVVVGIPNTDRTRDLTPTHVSAMFGDSAFVKTSGGGDKFLDFIEKELIPYVENKYPVNSYRTFVGHSLGGLTVVYTLLTRPKMFSNYVAIDPSLWWDNKKLLSMSDSIFREKDFRNISLYVGVANTMREGMDVANVDKDTTRDTQHIRSILEFVKSTDVLKSDDKLNFGWKYYGTDDHGSVPLITEYDAIRFLFPWYTLKGLDKFFSPESDATTENLLSYITSHYKNVSEHFGFPVNPPEQMINSLGYGFISSKMPEKAQAMFQLNIENYPESSNVWDSMGDYYISQSDTIKAIEYFSKAVELGNTTYSKEKLEKFKKAI